MKKVAFLDLRVTDVFERDQLIKAISTVMNHGRLVMGPEIEKFEIAVAEYCGRKFCVSVGSGTDALFLGLKGLNIGTGDEVITTSLSWVATANAIALNGAVPVFADIKDDLNIDPSSVVKLITSRTKAILTVDYTGRICEMEALEQICKQHNLCLIEDGSQSFGATRNGRRCGSFGVLSAISHNAMKVFGALGEAGSILCDDEALYNRLVSLRYNGTINRETCIEPSLNGRMDTLQAAVLLVRLKNLNNLISARLENANVYNKRLKDCVTIPIVSDYESHVYYTYTILTPQRERLRDYLMESGIETKIQHLLLMPEQPAYIDHAVGEFMNAKRLSKQYLCIPIHEKLTIDEVEYVANSILKFFASSEK